MKKNYEKLKYVALCFAVVCVVSLGCLFVAPPTVYAPKSPVHDNTTQVLKNEDFLSELNTNLLEHACNGNLAEIKSVLAEGADIDTRNKRGKTALLLSAEKGHLDCVKYLCEEGADINAESRYLDTALHLSAKNGHLEIIQHLIEEKNADIDINRKNSYNETALLLGAKNNHSNIVLYLAARDGVELNAQNNWKETALHWSVYNHNVTCVKCLVEQGANIDQKDMLLQSSPLEWAKKNCDEDIVSHFTSK